MPGHAPNNKLAALLAEAGWSAGDLARSVRALGAAQGLALRYDRTAVAHWLTGTRPRPPAPHLIAAALSERIGRLVTVQDAGFAPAPQAPSAPSSTPSAEADPVHHLLNLCRTETDPERRSFLAKTAYAVTTAASALPDFGALPVEGRKEPTGIQVATCDVEALNEMTQTFATLADRHGGAHVRAMLASYLADQVGRLLHAPANGALHNDLLRGAGQLTHLLALTNDDSGHPGLAQRYFRTALDLATRAGDARLYAITLRAMSAQALRLGHLRHALQLAEASISALPAHADPAPERSSWPSVPTPVPPTVTADVRPRIWPSPKNTTPKPPLPQARSTPIPEPAWTISAPRHCTHSAYPTKPSPPCSPPPVTAPRTNASPPP